MDPLLHAFEMLGTGPEKTHCVGRRRKVCRLGASRGIQAQCGGNPRISGSSSFPRSEVIRLVLLASTCDVLACILQSVFALCPSGWHWAACSTLRHSHLTPRRGRTVGIRWALSCLHVFHVVQLDIEVCIDIPHPC